MLSQGSASSPACLSRIMPEAHCARAEQGMRHTVLGLDHNSGGVQLCLRHQTVDHSNSDSLGQGVGTQVEQ